MEKSGIHYRNSKRQKTAVWIVWGIVTLYAITLVAPFIWTLFNAFKTEREFAESALSFSWHWDNMVRTFTELEVDGVNFIAMIVNSLLFSGIHLLPAIFIPFFSAYACSKFPSKFTKGFYWLQLLIMSIPTLGSFPAYYKLLVAFGIKNNYSMIWILSCSGGGMMFFLFHSFLNGVSWTYAEAAKIDGAGNWRIMFQIMLPMAKGIVIAQAVVTFIGFWNDYSGPMLYMNEFPTIAVGLYRFHTLQMTRANRPIFFMGVIYSLIPTVILFVCFSKTFMSSITIGGLKG